MVVWILAGMGWLACGLLAAGWMYADLIDTWDSLDSFMYVVALFLGPIGIFFIFLNRSIYDVNEGWRFPFGKR